MASTEKSARGSSSPMRHSKPNVLLARVSGRNRTMASMSAKAAGEISAGGTRGDGPRNSAKSCRSTPRRSYVHHTLRALGDLARGEFPERTLALHQLYVRPALHDSAGLEH